MKYTYETISQLQLKDWNYEEKERKNAVLPTEPRLAPRYEKQGNVYVNPSAQNTGRAKILIAGDQMCQEGVIRAKKKKGPVEDYDFDSCYRLVKDLFRAADLSIGNLETIVHPEAPYANEQLYIGKWYNRNCPPQYLDTLRSAGFDLLATANNHMLDTGMKGLYRTCELLDSFGFIHTGSFPDTDVPRYALAEVNGIRVGVLSYTFFYNFPAAEYIRPEGIRDVLNQYTKEKARRDVAAAKEAGAEYIICCIHWGKEMVHTSTERQRQVAQELADAGVDYIAGSHAHVIQPYDVLTADDGRKVPVIYSLGNLLCHFTKAEPKTSVILELNLTRNDDGSITVSDSYIPCYVFAQFDGWMYTIVPLTNKRYQYNDTNRTVLNRKTHAASVLGPKIRPSHSFDVPESENPAPKPTRPQIVDRDFLFQEPSKLQMEFLDAYRLTDKFRRQYGEYLVDHFASGQSVTAAIEAIREMTGEENVTTESHRALIADMVYTKLVLGFAYWEYFVYGLQDKTPLERTEFMPQRQNVAYYRKFNTNRSSIKILNDKYLSYETFKDYYKRDVLKVTGEDGLEPFRHFVANHPRFIAKPFNAATGKGVQLFDRKDYDSDEALFRQLMHTYVETEKTAFLCEELIIAHPAFAAIHPESINSMRIFTYYDGIEPRVACAWLKAGRGASVVDNGGLVAAIDHHTGTICTVARSKYNDTFAAHPDTGFVFKGFQIEGWEEAVAMAKEASTILPGLRCIGWDIARSADKGWQIIEGNAHGMFNFLQVATQKGMRREFLKAIEWDLYKDT